MQTVAFLLIKNLWMFEYEMGLKMVFYIWKTTSLLSNLLFFLSQCKTQKDVIRIVVATGGKKIFIQKCKKPFFVLYHTINHKRTHMAITESL